MICTQKKIKLFLFCLSLITIIRAEAQVKAPPPTAVSFQKIQLYNNYISEGASIGDIDADGFVDIIAGPLWWKGTDLKKMVAYDTIEHFPITGPGFGGYATNFFTFPSDFNDDGYCNSQQKRGIRLYSEIITV